MKSPQNSPKPAETSAYLQGRAAFQQGSPYDSCPYEGRDQRANDWQWGHYDAEREAASKAREAAR